MSVIPVLNCNLGILRCISGILIYDGILMVFYVIYVSCIVISYIMNVGPVDEASGCHRNRL